MNDLSTEQLSKIPWLNIFNQTIDQPETLPVLLGNHGVKAFHLAKLAKESLNATEAYGRKIIFKNDEIEVMLAKWSFKAMAAPHNHGSSKGLIWFAQGNFQEQHYQFKNKNLMQVDRAQFYFENQVVTVEQSDIHSCQPETVGVSLHIYSPPIHDMKVWDSEKKRTLIVADNCGAWIPENKDLIISEKIW